MSAHSYQHGLALSPDCVRTRRGCGLIPLSSASVVYSRSFQGRIEYLELFLGGKTSNKEICMKSNICSSTHAHAFLVSIIRQWVRNNNSSCF